MRNAVLLAALALSALAAPVRADVMYTVTFAGTINNGTDNGDFGGINVAGQNFIAVETFDGSTGSLSSNSGGSVLSSPVASATVTVNAHTIAFTGLPADNVYELFSSGYNIYAQVDNGPSYVVGSLYANTGDFLPGTDFGEMFSGSVPSGAGYQNSFALQYYDGTNIHATISTISLNGASTPTPEPASLTLFGAGLGALGWLRRRRR